MKKIILFRFHTDVDTCKNRLGLLKKYNPEVKIFGLFGGQEKELERFQSILDPYLESIYCVRGKSPDWKRTHGDLVMKLWYESIGKTIVFDTLYYIEWDLLLFGSLEKIYGHIPENSVGLTSLTLLKNIEKEWFWLSDGSFRDQWQGLLGFVKDKYGYDQEPYACEFSGACIPRGFLEQYNNAEIPELCHDELRIPLFSQVFNFKFYNTGLCRKWFDGSEQRLFNCDNKEISLSTITKELVKPSGRRAFHPVRRMFVFDKPASGPRNPIISVIVPTYNCAAYIAEALDSILSQTFTDYEVIVVDDGSTDNTREVVSRYGDGVRYIYQENKGVSAARNTGIKNVQGRFMAFLDADDVWLPKKLEWQMKAISESDSIGVVACGLFCVNREGHRIKEIILKDYPSKNELIKDLYFGPDAFFGAGSSILVRKDCFQRSGLFDEDLKADEDWDLCLRIAKSYDTRFVPLPLLEYRARDGSSVSGMNVAQFLTHELQFIDKVFQSHDLKGRLFLKARARSHRYLRAAGACEDMGQFEEAKKFMLKAFFIYPPIFFRRSILAQSLFLMFGRSKYERLKNVVRCVADLSVLKLRREAARVLKKCVKQLMVVLRFATAMVMVGDQKELIIIVTYRDRAANLKQFIPHMHAFLKNIKHRIVVIEQAGDGLFNKGKLLNVGFSLYQNANAFFCFHDVDLFPESASCDYSYPVMPTHLSACCSQFEYQFMPHYFGGVVLVNKEDFQRVNGSSNQYWGWGGEDDDLRKRFDMTWTIPLGRRMGRYHSIERLLAFHDPQAHADIKRRGNPHYQKNCIRLGLEQEGLLYDPKTDGLSDLKYELIETITEEGYVKHIVRL